MRQVGHRYLLSLEIEEQNLNKNRGRIDGVLAAQATTIRKQRQIDARQLILSSTRNSRSRRAYDSSQPSHDHYN